MKFLIINTDYSEFLGWLYAQNPGLEKQPYDNQMRARNESLFGTADFYSSNLCKLGHEAWDIHANNEFMQKMWPSEHRIDVDRSSNPSRKYKSIVWRGVSIAAKTPLRHLRPLVRSTVRSIDNQQNWLYDILAAQIRYHKPDVLFNLNMGGISSRFLKEMKPYIKLLVGQHAATRLSDADDFSCYDLVTSSFPPTVEYFCQKGIHAELNRLAFEPNVLSYLEVKGKTYDVTFVGSFFSVHSSRTKLLETICARFPQTRIWGPEINQLPPNSPIRGCYEGQAWGVNMFQILHRSKITLNHHGDVAPYANNMRLYEATGIGALLVTDWKENLHEMFEPAKEVVAYRSAEECIELIEYYMNHDKEREAIARAGQARTLREHTYYQRVQELIEIIKPLLQNRRAMS